MAHGHTIDFGKPIPVFPLPTLVLLPHVTAPLHIFEPRYRQMVREALDSHGLIAMAAFADSQWKSDYEGTPPIRDHVCVGYIVRHERLPDGRYNILLQGICRARVLNELPPRPFRVAMMEPTDLNPASESGLNDARREIERLLAAPALAGLASVAALRNWFTPEIPTTAMVDLMGVALCEDGEERYRLLVETDARVRARCMVRYLRHTLRTIQTAERYRAVDPEDGLSMN